MELLKYHRMRTAIQSNAFPGSGEDVAAVAGQLRDLLRFSGLFETVEVEPTDDPDQLVIALCQFKAELEEADVSTQLEKIWVDRLRYPFWEAHTVIADLEHVELEAATRASELGHYVTIHLVAKKSAIPAQREPVD
jgi:hypothetical protein